MRVGKASSDLHTSSPLGSNVDPGCVGDEQVGRKMQRVRQVVRSWTGYDRRGCQLRGLVTTGKDDRGGVRRAAQRHDAEGRDRVRESVLGW